MPFVTVGRENSAAIRIYYEDHGSGPPVVLVHGYALNGHSWEKQEVALLAAGHRVITYDRRGFGASSRPSTGYDFSTLAADLHVLLSPLRPARVVLAGFAMGTGEVTRYLAAHGPARVRAAVLVAPLLPFPLKTDDSPEGIDRSVFDGITAGIAADRPAAMKDFMDRSYNVDLLGGGRVSDQAWQNSFYVAISASAPAALGCVTACQEDFRDDLAKVSIPVLNIHGDQDRILPCEATSRRLPALLNNARSTLIAGGPHAIISTHANEVNQALLDFIGHLSPAGNRQSRPGTPRRLDRPADPCRSDQHHHACPGPGRVAALCACLLRRRVAIPTAAKRRVTSFRSLPRNNHARSRPRSPGTRCRPPRISSGRSPWACLNDPVCLMPPGRVPSREVQ